MAGKKLTDSSNYYRILGTNSNANDDLIKERYLEKVRAFPPEQYPEEFKKIREAYDTLKDPFKRSEYDLKTKYQGKASRLMKKAIEEMKYGFFDEAEELLNEASGLAQDNLYILKVQAHLALLKGNLTEYYQKFTEIEGLVQPGKLYLVFINKIGILLEDERPKQALKVLREIEKKFPDKKEEMIDIYLSVYDQLGKFNKLWSILSNHLKGFNEINEDNIRVFIAAILLINKHERWEKKESLIEHTVSFIDMIKQDEETVEIVLDQLHENLDEAAKYGDTESQLFFIEMALLFREDPSLIKEKEKLELVRKMMKEINRMANDDRISPFIFYHCSQLFFRWAYPDQDPEFFVDFPDKIQMEAFENEAVENISAIERLKNSYPSLYNFFPNEWIKLERKFNKPLTDYQQLNLFENRLDPEKNSDYKRLANGQIINENNVGRNDPCPCGSGKKYKKCCMNKN